MKRFLLRMIRRLYLRWFMTEGEWVCLFSVYKVTIGCLGVPGKRKMLFLLEDRVAMHLLKQRKMIALTYDDGAVLLSRGFGFARAML